MGTNITKAVRYERESKDFACYVNGELVGYEATETQGWALVNGLVSEIIADRARAVADEVAGEEVASAVVVIAPDRAAVAAELIKARNACADNARWLRAANKAAIELDTGRWAWNGRVLVVRSRTSDRQYRCTPTTCECQAAAKGSPCWHRAAAKLVQNATKAA